MKMEKQELAPHVSEIARVLGNKIDEKDIEKELDTYLNLYRVSLETAKRSVVRKLGGDPNALTMGVRKLIAELSGTEMSVDLLVKVLTVNHKDIEQNGETKQILYGLMADEGGSIAYTAWDAERFQLERGKVYLIRNAYTKEWNSQPQLNLSTRATIEPQPDDSMKLPEGMDVPSYGPTNATVVELKEGMNSVTITAKVISSEGRKLETPNGPKQVFSGIMADATGKVQFSAWHDFGLKSGDTIIIRGAYVRTWRGIPQLNFSERAGVERTKTSFGSDQELSRPRPRSIGELESIGGAVDVLVRGVVVDIKKGSGLIFRCPQCKRLVQKGLCRIHGKVDGQPDLRIKAVVDDGMAALTAVLNKDITEMLVGITLAESLREAKEAMNPEVVEEKVKDRMLGKPIEVRGNVTSDEYGLMMIVTEAELKVPEVRSEAASLLSELEGAQ
jgi:replication factor A1